MLTKNYSIQLKAAFLLIVFALNTVVGFACAVGVDMGFNHNHHQDEATEAAIHIHADGKKHIHQENRETAAHRHHAHNASSHHHDKADLHHPLNDGKDNCCNDKVIKLAQDDKALSPSLHIAIHPVFFTAFVSSFCNIDVSANSQVTKHSKYFVRSHHPPIPDIRIAIQSFQI